MLIPSFAWFDVRNLMKRLFIPLLAGIAAMMLLVGCETHLGGGTLTK